jgi:hypothetical protein
VRLLPADTANAGGERHCAVVRTRSSPVIAFFSNRLGCMGSLLVSVVATLALLLVLGLLD